MDDNSSDQHSDVRHIKRRFGSPAYCGIAVGQDLTEVPLLLRVFGLTPGYLTPEITATAER